jgi:hypothetical protein
MEALLKRYYTKLQYFVGSIMNIADLQRVQVGCFRHDQEENVILTSFFCVKVDKATACLIIANKACPDPNNDDSANIMRVISLKNFNCRIRILLQLLRYHNKVRRIQFIYVDFKFSFS